ncbi:MAG: CopG family transcriptional regulator [Myxococcota bacterium]
MRTTLTLDPDVAEALQRLREEKDLSLRDLANRALRIGLAEIERPPRREPFRTRTVSLGPRSSNVDDVAEVLALAEGDDYR